MKNEQNKARKKYFYNMETITCLGWSEPEKWNL